MEPENQVPQIPQPNLRPPASSSGAWPSASAPQINLEPAPTLAPDQQAFINKWSFGAFIMSPIYFFASGLILEGLLVIFVPFYNIYLYFKGIFRGRRMSWAKGNWKDFETFKKRQKFLDRLGIIFLCLEFLLIGGIIVLVMVGTNASRKEAHQFLDEISAGKITAAYNETTSDFQKQTSLEDFKTMVAGDAVLKNQESVSFNHIATYDDGSADFSGTLTGKNGSKEPIELKLMYDSDGWKVQYLKLGDFNVEENSKNDRTVVTQKNGVTGFTEDQLSQMLMPEGSSTEEMVSQETAIQYIFKHPEEVNPFAYAELSNVLIKQGNMEQGAFWFYIFQSRTGAWVAEDPDESASPALKSSINEVLGTPINGWIASDVNAWHDLVAKAISYEKTFPFYSGKIDSVSDQQWQKDLLDYRQKYEDGFNSNFKEILADNGKSFLAQRKANGLYVGPWQNLGKPLLTEWK